MHARYRITRALGHRSCGTALALRSHESEQSMMSPFWLLWLVFLLMFLVAPLGYGWGYRGWGPPYPRYVQRRRAVQVGTGDPSSINHQAWGRAGDLVWLGLIVAMVWAVSAFVWLR
jgi:hypothetical protein